MPTFALSSGERPSLPTLLVTSRSFASIAVLSGSELPPSLYPGPATAEGHSFSVRQMSCTDAFTYRGTSRAAGGSPRGCCTRPFHGLWTQVAEINTRLDRLGSLPCGEPSALPYHTTRANQDVRPTSPPSRAVALCPFHFPVSSQTQGPLWRPAPVTVELRFLKSSRGTSSLNILGLSSNP